MKIRAVIFDVYKTLLEVGPPPADAEQIWKHLWTEFLGDDRGLSLNEFSEACQRIIEAEHATAKQNGILFPEVFWPDITTQAAPGLAGLSHQRLDDFLFRHAQLCRTVQMNPGAAALLAQLRSVDVKLGIASNAQPYTLRELEGALKPYALSMRLFEPRLCFWSFEHGFSKPDPHVFRLLTARLKAFNVHPESTLMVGDREDNDILPARVQGWHTWHLKSPLQGTSAWECLANSLEISM